MGILAGDVKLVASQVMDDVPEGGGQPTATVIADGVSNAVFPDISELDRAGGRVNLRKLHAHVQTEDTDGYFGVNVIVAEGPQDPRVAITLFTTRDTFDRRDDAKNRIEAYLAPGPEWPGFLLENHIAGQRAIQLLQQLNSDIVPVGHTLLLVQDEGLVTEKSQYVRTTRVTTQTRSFVNAGGKAYSAMVVTAEISDPLRVDFRGTAPNEFFQRDAAAAKTRDTVVADAANYFGVAKLAEEVNIGDLAARAETIFTQLVPSAQTEIPLADFNAAGQKTSLVESANGTVSYITSQPFNSTTVLSVGTSVKPGSLAISGAATLTDDGGQVFDGATAVGTIDYARGEVRFAQTSPAYNGTKTVTFRPVGAPLQLADTASVAVTQETRAFNYIVTITPPPAPGTTQVSYRANGKWYTLQDNGGGVIKGSDSSFGSGTVSYATGTISVTAGALPDVGSSVLYAWGSPATYINRSGVTPPVPRVTTQLAHTGIAPGTLALTWNDGVARTATDNGHGGITGDATGTIRYQTGEVEFTPTSLPAGNQEYTADYAWGAPSTMETDTVEEVAGVATLDLGQTDILPGSVEVDVAVQFDKSRKIGSMFQPAWSVGSKTVRLVDDAAGNMKFGAVTVGAINYGTGVLTFNLGLTTIGYSREVYAQVLESAGHPYVLSSTGV